ncbi:hypothetical protein BB561_005200 [Smittium simulii]|uniref:BRCA2 OB1 domain-containing protein n=1 Tax=Smittium simulii TaxID=133385 RepID=A0A2T9YBH0_9FUNG|nr:hypothetical protein BB561_005200 [Smittium simulii]
MTDSKFTVNGFGKNGEIIQITSYSSSISNSQPTNSIHMYQDIYKKFKASKLQDNTQKLNPHTTPTILKTKSLDFTIQKSLSVNSEKKLFQSFPEEKDQLKENKNILGINEFSCEANIESDIGLAETDLQIIDSMYWDDFVEDIKDPVKSWDEVEEKNTQPESSSSIPGLESKDDNYNSIKVSEVLHFSNSIKKKLSTPEIASRLLLKPKMCNNMQNHQAERSHTLKKESNANKSTPNLNSNCTDNESNINTQSLLKKHNSDLGYMLTPKPALIVSKNFKNHLELPTDILSTDEPTASTPNVFITSPDFGSEYKKQINSESFLANYSPTAKFSKRYIFSDLKSCSSKAYQSSEGESMLANTPHKILKPPSIDGCVKASQKSQKNILSSPNFDLFESNQVTINDNSFCAKNYVTNFDKNTFKIDHNVNVLLSDRLKNSKITSLNPNPVYFKPNSLIKTNNERKPQEDFLVAPSTAINNEISLIEFQSQELDFNSSQSEKNIVDFGFKIPSAQNLNSNILYNTSSMHKETENLSISNEHFVPNQGSLLKKSNLDFDNQLGFDNTKINPVSRPGQLPGFIKSSGVELKFKSLDRFINQSDTSSNNLIDTEIVKKMEEDDKLFESILSRSKNVSIKEFKTPFKKPIHHSSKKINNQTNDLNEKGDSTYINRNSNDSEDLFEEVLKKSKLNYSSKTVSTFKTPFKNSHKTNGSNMEKNTSFNTNNKSSYEKNSLNPISINADSDINYQNKKILPNNSNLANSKSFVHTDSLTDMLETEADKILSKYGGLEKASISATKTTSINIIKDDLLLEKNKTNSEKITQSNNTVCQSSNTALETPTKPESKKRKDNDGFNINSGRTDAINPHQDVNRKTSLNSFDFNKKLLKHSGGFNQLSNNCNSSHLSFDQLKNDKSNDKCDLKLNQNSSEINLNLNKGLEPFQKDHKTKNFSSKTVPVNSFDNHQINSFNENNIHNVPRIDIFSIQNEKKPIDENIGKNKAQDNLLFTPISKSSKVPERKLIHSQGLRRPNSLKANKVSIFKSPVPINQHKVIFKSPAFVNKPKTELIINRSSDINSKDNPSLNREHTNEKSNKRLTLKQFFFWAQKYKYNDKFVSSEDVKYMSFEKAKNYKFSSSIEDQSRWGSEEALNQLKSSQIDIKVSSLSESELKVWISNHFQQIVWYLGAFSRFFPQFEYHFWKSEAVNTRLINRFKKEFYEVHRSSIRKILEKDSSSKSLIVLCVASILTPKLILLTDGWYSIRGQVDSVLSSAINRGRLKVGAKLVITGANLIMPSGTNEGISPWQIIDPISELSPTLIINSNSVRTCAWYHKLGFQKKHFNLSYSIHTLNPSGGPAYGELDIVVCRRYPIRYIESLPNNTRITRSSAEESRVGAEHNLKETTYAQDLYRNFDDSCFGKAKIKIQSINFSELDDKSGDEIFDLYRSCNDQQAFYSMLTPELRNSLQDHISLSRSENNENIKTKLLEIIPQRKVSSFFQILVDDFSVSPKDNKKKYSRIVMSLWNVDMSIWEQFTEGSRDVDIFAKVTTCQPTSHLGQDVTMLVLSLPSEEDKLKFSSAANYIGSNGVSEMRYNPPKTNSMNNISNTVDKNFSDLSNLSALYNSGADKGLEIYEKMNTRINHGLHDDKVNFKAFFSVSTFGNLNIKEGSVIYIKDLYLNYYDHMDGLYTAISRDYTDLVILYTPALLKKTIF